MVSLFPFQKLSRAQATETPFMKAVSGRRQGREQETSVGCADTHVLSGRLDDNTSKTTSFTAPHDELLSLSRVSFFFPSENRP